MLVMEHKITNRRVSGKIRAIESQLYVFFFILRYLIDLNL